MTAYGLRRSRILSQIRRRNIHDFHREWANWRRYSRCDWPPPILIHPPTGTIRTIQEDNYFLYTRKPSISKE